MTLGCIGRERAKCLFARVSVKELLMSLSHDSIVHAVALCLWMTCTAHAAHDGAQSAAVVRDSERLRLDFGALADPASDAEFAEDPWRAEFIMWLWLMGVDGDIGARGLVKNVSADFVDVLEATDSIIGVAGRLNIGRGRWTGFIDGMYTKIGVEDVTITGADIRPDANINVGPGPFDPDFDLNLGLLPTEIDVTMEITIIDFGLSYEIAQWSMGENFDTLRKLTLDAYAGARFTHGEVTIDPANFSDVTNQSDWIDPIIGAKALVPFTDKLDIQIWGDVGGFGAASDLTWSATAVIGYRFKLFDLPSVVFAGYRGLGYDYTGDSLEWDLVLHGPLFGLGVAF